jgi:uncharacterized membrane protein
VFNLKPLKWLAIILIFTALTLLVTYLLPVPSGSEFSYNLIPRYIFSFIFISFVPGYCIVKILFIGKNALDLIEELVLSVALSFGLTGLLGLFLGLSPIGITFTSVTVSLSVLVLVLSSIAFIRKLREPDVQST